MYESRPNLIIGFHGCDEDTCRKLLNEPDNIEISKKPYDWLGNGVYFWENNQERAYKWAVDKQNRGQLKKATVIGAIINLGYCFDLLDSKYIQTLAVYHELMTNDYKTSGDKISGISEIILIIVQTNARGVPLLRLIPLRRSLDIEHRA